REPAQDRRSRLHLVDRDRGPDGLEVEEAARCGRWPALDQLGEPPVQSRAIADIVRLAIAVVPGRGGAPPLEPGIHHPMQGPNDVRVRRMVLPASMELDEP